MSFLNKKKKGFTLIELMVSVFVFLIIMTVIIEIFGKQIVTARSARILQRNIEEAKFAMNYLAKTLRTSTLPNDKSIGAENLSLEQSSENTYTKTIYAYDYSQALCFKFSFEDDKLVMYTGEADPSGIINYCATNGVYSGEGRELTKGKVKGGFYISPTIPDKKEPVNTPEIYDETMGKVTIVMEIDNRNTESVKQGESGVQNMIIIQTSVSLRDYPGDITF